MSGDSKAAFTRATHQADMKLLGQVLEPEVLAHRVPRLGDLVGARALHRERIAEISALGKFHRSTGYTAGRTMQYIAQIDQSVWNIVLTIFSDELYPDGKLSKTFFYALLAGPLKNYDMRGKIIL